MTHILCVLFMPFVITACLFEEPKLTENGEIGVDPTEVNVSMTLSFRNVPFVNYKARAVRGEQSVRVYYYRANVAFYDEGREVRRVTQYMPYDEMVYDVDIPIIAKVHARRYKVAAWVDFVYRDEISGKENIEDYSSFYDVENLRLIIRTPYSGCDEYVKAFYGNMEIDLYGYADMWNVSIPVDLELSCPMSRYELVATDVDEFLKNKDQYGEIRDNSLHYIAQYKWYLPTGFDALTGELRNPLQYVSYSRTVTLPKEGDKPVILMDYIFVDRDNLNMDGNGSFVVLDVKVTARIVGEKTDRVLGRISNFKVPYNYGTNTIFKGNFHTANQSLDIDTDFDGDFDIDIDLLP